jgi:tRNA pseudouridine55 synthase
VVDKPKGPTSHDVVDRVRRALGLRRVGHTGTLDPFASGVLPVCVGKATRLARFLVDGEKAYRATVHLGFATTTDDLTGEPIGPARRVAVPDEEVRAACARLTGPLLQKPPVYSAKRIAGERAYDLARQGVAVAPAAVPVEVYGIAIVAWQVERLEIDVRCSPGTYIRALARDLGELLGTGAHLIALRRTRSGGFGLEDAVAWDAIDANVGERLRPMVEAVRDLPAVRLAPEGLAALRHGRDVTPALVAEGFPENPAPRLRVLDAAGDLVALAVPRGFEPLPLPLRVEPVLHPDVVLI